MSEVVEVVVTEVLEISQEAQKKVEGFLILELERKGIEATQENMHKELKKCVNLWESVGISCNSSMYATGFNAFKDVLILWDRQFYITTVSVNGLQLQTLKGHFTRFEALFYTVKSLNQDNHKFLLDLLLCADSTQILVELSNTCSLQK